MFVYHVAESDFDFFGYIVTDRTQAIAAMKKGFLVSPMLATRFDTPIKCAFELVSF